MGRRQLGWHLTFSLQIKPDSILSDQSTYSRYGISILFQCLLVLWNLKRETTSWCRVFGVVFWQTAGINPVASECELVKAWVLFGVNSVIGLYVW